MGHKLNGCRNGPSASTSSSQQHLPGEGFIRLAADALEWRGPSRGRIRWLAEDPGAGPGGRRVPVGALMRERAVVPHIGEDSGFGEFFVHPGPHDPPASQNTPR